MNNYTLTTADRLTHLKIVVASLVASIFVVGVSLAARSNIPNMSAHLELRAPVFRAGQPVIRTRADQINVR